MSEEDDDDRRRYHTGDLTKALGVSRASLVYYEQTGLVAPGRDPANGTREYSDADVFDLVGFAALNNLGLSAKEVATAASSCDNLFCEDELEGYLDYVGDRIAYYNALRDSIDRMRAVRMRARRGPQVVVERIERHIFVEDGAEAGYLSFKASDDLDRLIKGVPISGFGVVFGLSPRGETTWRWGRSVPVRLASTVGFEQHCPMQVGGCDCVTKVACVVSERAPLEAESFGELYDAARQLGRRPAGPPFVPYIFPPHPGTPFKVCLPLE